jgi:hypothetical protein
MRHETGPDTRGRKYTTLQVRQRLVIHLVLLLQPLDGCPVIDFWTNQVVVVEGRTLPPKKEVQVRTDRRPRVGKLRRRDPRGDQVKGTEQETDACLHGYHLTEWSWATDPKAIKHSTT